MPRSSPRDPWRRAPVGELGEQLLPRWFVVLALMLVPLAVLVLVGAFATFRPGQVPPAGRRPPPSTELTSDVGRYQVGPSAPQPSADACAALRGVRIAGAPADQQALRRGLAGLCNATLPPSVAAAVTAFASAGGIVRFAQFEATGVDSAALRRAAPPVILINARLQRTDPLWVAPLVAHDAVLLAAGDRIGTAAAALEARQAEALVCDRVLAGRRSSRGCADARALLALDEPLAALRDAGYR